MDDFYGLDPLDRWLNSRQGRQLSALRWLQVFIWGFLLGLLLVWLPWELFGSVPAIVLPLIAAAAVVLAVPLRGLVAAGHARRSRRYPGKTGPELTWRWIAQACIAAILALVAISNQPAGWGRPGDVHKALGLLMVVLPVFMVVLALTTPRYLRRYAQARLGRRSG